MSICPSGSKKLWIIIIILAIIILGGLTAVFFIVLDEGDEAEINSQKTTNIVENTNQVNTNSEENENTNSVSNQTTNQNTNSSTDDEITTVNPTRPPRSEVVVTASSTLADISGAGIDYSPEQVIDQDFSTSWVEAATGDGTNEWIKMQFSAPAIINTLGIVPGYAQDNDIYLENNRVKKLELVFSDGTTVTKELSDNYGMHFVEFSTITTDYIKLNIKSVYSGTKYSDTAIAEMDIWSDYVLAKDAAAALKYYEDYKKTSGPTPQTLYIDKIYMAMGIMGGSTPEIPLDFYSPEIEPFVAAAEIPATTPSGITFTLKWYNENQLFHSENITNYSAFSGLDTITLSGAVYMSDLWDSSISAWPTGNYKTEWYEDGKLSESLMFGVTPQ